MSDDLFDLCNYDSVSVPRHGECTVASVLRNAGYVEFVAKSPDEEVLHAKFKASPLCCHFLWRKDDRAYMFDKWTGHKDKDGYEEPDAVIIRDVTDLLRVSA